MISFRTVLAALALVLLPSLAAAQAFNGQVDKAPNLTLSKILGVDSSGRVGLSAMPASPLVGTTDTQTLVNKTLTSPFINTINGNALPSGPIVGTTDTQTLTNKTLSNATATGSFTATGAFSAPAFPGLSQNIAATGTPGMRLPCTASSDCGFFIYQTPASYPAAGNVAFRVQREAPDTGGAAANTFKAIWALCTTGAHDAGYQWCNTAELYNQTLASTGAQNVASAGTVFKQLGTAAAGSNIGPSWGGNFVCDDRTGTVNPTASCIGTELDSYTKSGSGTDVNKQRVGLQIAMGVTGAYDAGVHFGYGILMGSSNGGVIDNAISIRDTNGTEGFNVKGTGNTTVQSGAGSWSSINIAPSLVVTSNPGVTNPAIGIFDSNNANGFAIANLAGAINFLSMPAVTSSAAPVNLATLTMSTKAMSFAGSVNSNGGYLVNGTAGANCGAGTVSLSTLVITNGIPTHC